MYVGSMFAPISLLGLLCKGSVAAAVAPATSVSVVVPVYNGEGTVENCIRSIMGQRLKPAQVIVIDDCSTDSTPVILGRLQQQYSNLTVLRNVENMGKAASLTYALDEVHGAHTAVVDSDTYLDEDYLLKTLGVFEDDVVGAHDMVMPSDTESLVARSRLIEYLHSQATYKKIHDKAGVNFVAPGCCAVWRTEWLKENGIPTDTVVEDMDLTWDAQDDNLRGAYTPEAVAYTEEPDTFRQYLKQIKRWFSWRPVMEKHASTMSRGLKGLIAWMMAESVTYIFWLGTFIYALFTGNYSLAAGIFGLDLAITLSIALYQGWKLDYALSEIVKSVPAYYLMRVPSMLMFWSTFIKPKRSGW